VKIRASILLLAFLAAAFAGGVLYLFNREFTGGDAYPPYSSLRSDPAGAKVLFESLSRLPGVAVSRSYQPFTACRIAIARFCASGSSRAVSPCNKMPRWLR